MKEKNQLCPEIHTVTGSRIKQSHNLGFTDNSIVSDNPDMTGN